jgi:hypothetical protein
LTNIIIRRKKIPTLAIENIEMKRKIHLSTNFAVFLLFFGVALFEAIRIQDWYKVAFWVAIGIVFLVADNLKKA